MLWCPKGGQDVVSVLQGGRVWMGGVIRHTHTQRKTHDQVQYNGDRKHEIMSILKMKSSQLTLGNLGTLREGDGIQRNTLKYGGRFCRWSAIAPVESGSTRRTVSRQTWWSEPEWAQMWDITRKKSWKSGSAWGLSLIQLAEMPSGRYDLITHPLSLELACWLILWQMALYALYASSHEYIIYGSPLCEVSQRACTKTHRRILPSAFLRVSHWWQVPVG